MNRSVVLAILAVSGVAWSGMIKPPPTVISTFNEQTETTAKFVEAQVIDPGLLHSPVRVAADELGQLYVGDSELNKVVVLSTPAKAPIRSFAVPGSVLGLGVAGGRVYVGNETLHRIEVYDTLGRFLFVLGGPGATVETPTDLSIDAAAGLLFAVDAREKVIRVFSLSGTGVLVRTISGPGFAPQWLQNPTGVALDTAAGEVLVADFGSINAGVPPRVAIFGYDGSFHGFVSGDGGAQGYFFSRPQGLTLGDSGHLFIADAWMGRVVVMDRATGAMITSLGELGDPPAPGVPPAPGRLRLPLDLVIVGAARDLYVVSNQTQSIQIFSEGGRQ